MLATTHVLSGLLIGTFIRRPTTAAAVGAVSHFVLDSLPHWGTSDDKDFMRVARRDGCALLAVLAVAACATPTSRRPSVLAGALGALAPDLNKPSRHFLGRSCYPKAVDRFHARIQKEDSGRMPQELLVGAVAAAGAVLRIRALARA
jgi:hypothetical protein